MTTEKLRKLYESTHDRIGPLYFNTINQSINLYLYGAFHTEKSSSKCLTEINKQQQKSRCRVGSYFFFFANKRDKTHSKQVWSNSFFQISVDIAIILLSWIFFKQQWLCRDNLVWRHPQIFEKNPNHGLINGNATSHKRTACTCPSWELDFLRLWMHRYQSHLKPFHFCLTITLHLDVECWCFFFCFFFHFRRLCDNMCESYSSRCRQTIKTQKRHLATLITVTN